MVGEEFLREIISQVTGKAAEPVAADVQDQAFGLENPISLKEYFVDTTCLEANIHYPVDWTLLRDATRTLMKAVRLIRREGVKEPDAGAGGFYTADEPVEHRDDPYAAAERWEAGAQEGVSLNEETDKEGNRACTGTPGYAKEHVGANQAEPTRGRTDYKAHRCRA